MILTPIKILISTANKKAFLLIKDILGKHFELIFAPDASTTLKTVFNDKVSLILLDTVQNIDIGCESLFELLYGINETKHIPIIIMSQERGVFTFNNYGLNCEMYTHLKLMENVEKLLLRNTNYFDRNEDIQNFVSSLILALESKDKYSRNHSARVARYATQIAKDIDSSKDFLTAINLAGLFHDIGKIGIPDDVLLKPDHLSNEEFNIIKSHPEKSERICAPIKAFDKLLAIIRGHHERYDGRGYPDHLKGEDIPIEARIIAVADAFDALTSNRAYRHAYEIERVVEILKKNAGTQWDKDIIDCFLANFEEKKMIEVLRQTPFISFSKQENLIEGTIFDKRKI